MVTGDSPAAARRRVRLALREARTAAGLTQSQVAEEMEWSLSKVIRIETGEVSISPNDLRPLLGYLGIRDRGRIDQLVADARASRRVRRALWWNEPEYREHLTDANRQLIQYDAEATAIKHLNTMFVPGPLQIPAYAEAILTSYREEMPDATIEVRLRVRQRRRQELLDRKPPPQILLLLDESALYRQVGGPAVLAEQLSELLRLIRAGRLRVRIVPFAAQSPLPQFGAYDIVELTEDDDAVVYRESHLMDEIVEDPAKVARHRGIFERMWATALDEDTSTALIEKAVKALPTGRRRASGAGKAGATAKTATAHPGAATKPGTSTNSGAAKKTAAASKPAVTGKTAAAGRARAARD